MKPRYFITERQVAEANAQRRRNQWSPTQIRRIKRRVASAKPIVFRKIGLGADADTLKRWGDALWSQADPERHAREQARLQAVIDAVNGGTGMVKTEMVYPEGAERTADHSNAVGVLRTRWISRSEFERGYTLPPGDLPDVLTVNPDYGVDCRALIEGLQPGTNYMVKVWFDEVSYKMRARVIPRAEYELPPEGDQDVQRGS